ncbi:5'/3'-nucleotidase SurE [Vibrio maritimus]
MKYSLLFALMGSVLAPATVSANTLEPMRILVVSDDGCQSEGSQALFEALNDKGYDVWLSAPLDNKSGTGTAVTFKLGKELKYKKIAERQYCFDGTPVDSVLFGLTGLMADKKPDLVISGVNDGPNVGVNQFNSGTVGAAARAVRHGVPALAVSMGFRLEELKIGMPSSLKYIPDGVAHTLSIVEKLDSKRVIGEPLLPKGTGLSINYPPYPAEEVKGIEYVANEVSPDYNYYFKILGDGKTVQEANFQPFKDASNPEIVNDTTQLMRKHITYSVFQGHWNATQYEQEYKSILN